VPDVSEALRNASESRLEQAGLVVDLDRVCAERSEADGTGLRFTGRTGHENEQMTLSA
jgi:hypothetical protein